MEEITRKIDHTNLKCTASIADITRLCHEAIEINFKSVCVNPYYVKLAYRLLADTKIKVTSVVAFPLGALSLKQKINETIEIINNGAHEIDMVINLGAVKNQDWDLVNHEISQIRAICTSQILKIIIEVETLTEAEIIKLCKICCTNQVDFIKTSTGFYKQESPVLPKTIRLIKKYSGSRMKIKASGGIKTYNQALALVEAGADRIGTSSGIKIASEIKALATNQP